MPWDITHMCALTHIPYIYNTTDHTTSTHTHTHTSLAHTHLTEMTLSEFLSLAA